MQIVVQSLLHIHEIRNCMIAAEIERDHMVQIFEFARGGADGFDEVGAIPELAQVVAVGRCLGASLSTRRRLACVRRARLWLFEACDPGWRRWYGVVIGVEADFGAVAIDAPAFEFAQP